jgi:hypothetical protein
MKRYIVPLCMLPVAARAAKVKSARCLVLITRPFKHFLLEDQAASAVRSRFQRRPPPPPLTHKLQR